MLPALGICAGVGVEGEADGAACLRMSGQRDEEQQGTKYSTSWGLGCPASRHGVRGQAAWLGSHVFDIL